MKRNELPTEKSLKKLPRWGRVAVIARALRRVMPLIAAMLERGSAKILESIEFALIQAELSAAEGGSSEHLLWSCNQLAELARTVAHDSDDCDEDYTRSAILAAYLVTTCCINADEEIEIEALEAISNVVFHFERFKRRKALRKAADKMVMADFDRLPKLPADYRKFLKTYDGETEYIFDGIDGWRFFSTEELTEIIRIDRQKVMNIHQLQAYAKSVGEYVGDETEFIKKGLSF